MKSAVIVAGGNSVRYGSNKLNQDLLGFSVLQRSVQAFLPIVDEVIVVGAQVDGTVYAPAGDTRSKSVRNGLAAVSKGCTLVAIHDAARPFVSSALISELFAQAEIEGNAIPAIPVTDTIWQQTDMGLSLQNRSQLTAVQTPQVFSFEQITHAFEVNGGDFADESSLYYAVYGKLNFCQGQRSNVKITLPGDLPAFRVGNGFDVHPFGEGNGVILGGVTIPFDKKLVGHSDADVLCHALCDAILSASGNKDIGHQFPDTDQAYRGADSTKLLGRCVQLAAKGGFEVVNVSAVVVCQQPKISPHEQDIVLSLAKVLGIALSCVSISATTTEKLGALGNGDGIACEATALLACRNA